MEMRMIKNTRCPDEVFHWCSGTGCILVPSGNLPSIFCPDSIGWDDNWKPSVIPATQLKSLPFIFNVLIVVIKRADSDDASWSPCWWCNLLPNIFNLKCGYYWDKSSIYKCNCNVQQFSYCSLSYQLMTSCGGIEIMTKISVMGSALS